MKPTCPPRSVRTGPRSRDAYIIAVSGFGRDDDIARSKEAAGMDDHLTKPIDNDDVLARIERRGARRR